MLKEHVDKLAILLQHPWFLNSQFSVFHEAVCGLFDAVNKYLTFLLELQQERTAKAHASPQPVRSMKDHWSLTTIEGSMAYVVSKKHQSIFEALGKMNPYEILSLQEYEPDDKKQRKSWVESLKFTFPVMKFAYPFGNYLGTLHILWKLPAKIEDRKSELDIKIMNEIREQIPVYSTRAMRREFIESFSAVPNLQPAVLRSIHVYIS